MSKKEKESFHDDGRTIVSMDFEGTRWSRSNRSSAPPQNVNRKEFSELNLTKKERRAMMLAAFSTVFPLVAGFAILYFIAFLLMDLIWLR